MLLQLITIASALALTTPLNAHGRAGPCDAAPACARPSRRGALLAAALAFGAAIRPATADEPADTSATPATTEVYEGPKAARFTAIYEDDLHPGCDRRIVVEQRSAPDEHGSEYVAHFHMSDVGPPGVGHVVKLACDASTMGAEKEQARAASPHMPCGSLP